MQTVFSDHNATKLEIHYKKVNKVQSHILKFKDNRGQRKCGKQNGIKMKILHIRFIQCR